MSAEWNGMSAEWDGMSAEWDGMSAEWDDMSGEWDDMHECNNICTINNANNVIMHGSDTHKPTRHSAFLLITPATTTEVV